MSTRRIKVLVWAAAIIAVWQLIVSPTSSRAIVLFVMDGEVPGTGKSLTPDGVFAVLGGLFVLSVILIFWKEWRKLATWLFGHKDVPVAATIEADPSRIQTVHADQRAMRQTAPISVKAAKTTRVSRRAAAAVTARPILVIPKQQSPSAFAQALTRLNPVLVRTLAGLRHASLVVSLAVLLAAQRAYSSALKGARNLGFIVTREAVRAFFAVRVYVQEYWRWQRPHLERFDKWLEKQVKIRQGETGRTLAVVVRETRKGMNEIKANFETARWQTHADHEEKLLGDDADEAL